MLEEVVAERREVGLQATLVPLWYERDGSQLCIFSWAGETGRRLGTGFEELLLDSDDEKFGTVPSNPI